jgi:DNA-binding NtrC family response regulator
MPIDDTLRDTADLEEAAPATLKERLEDYERQLILSALNAHRGHQARAARFLGLLPTTLHEKMKRLGLLRRRRATEEGGHGLASDPR